ncbi:MULTISPECIES: ATP-binding protein [Streptomyces]|uniref:ATP-binding protein n=1 Tax=Streptomyces venezuelae TaxID=54571 RepID=A0A5P2BAT5_STRVZ|nr:MULTISPECIES: ATP-binding protein [Streptomyces]NDZ98004.1 ATP-binding protein [Streptomyces sp. SID10116]MYY86591.1 ATP-binding protein [Streptomyces sp. SID335]MYZ18265.1 ATP-binding protein [Streptomyces sp. SID337]NDZ92243.1 ATP-binding protein [Streptomyces sp. SID10115]NEB44899.1 ATP-binding protein [Streptomyces sp. SID339]
MQDPGPAPTVTSLPAPDFELDLLAVPKAIPDLRRVLRTHPYGPLPDVQLCVSELLSNVIRHLGEGTPVTVRLTTAHGRIRVAVTDPDPRAWPLLRSAGSDDETGRGLALLDAVSLRWGVEQEADRKTVWCELGEG